ncbi:uncharacterized protein CLUP02_00933 [Colletotrichum lupini]|uniref:Uncharacterized protein n=1 Tax=Colletotrichum lupini TaxID=145971 RepID=A0A9Q8W9F8_9PEZI|nr:uncharacterized protein CLUP02_00933 [Colletotrichum lupini]UQC74285.1 hypothetical protein CLUP02_00933 [Colletotrichum lupini]
MTSYSPPTETFWKVAQGMFLLRPHPPDVNPRALTYPLEVWTWKKRCTTLGRPLPAPPSPPLPPQADSFPPAAPHPLDHASGSHIRLPYATLKVYLSLVQSRYICPGNKSTWYSKCWFVPGGVWRVRVVGCWSQSNKVTQPLTDSVDLGLEVPSHPPSTLSLTQVQNASLAPVPFLERAAGMNIGT